MSQLGLNFNAPKPEPVNEDPGTLVDYLRGKGWMTADQIGVALGWSDRRVRKAASAGEEVLSYPGSPGYKLLHDCSPDEYQRFRDVTRHQAREMLGRVFRADRRRFGRTGFAI